MANVKISELPVATSLSNGDSFPVVQGGVTKQAARSVLFANPTFTGTTTADLLTATGDVTFDGGAFVFNESGADKDARFEGDTDANLLFLDASTNRIGIGTATPAAKLDVNGSAAITGNVTLTGDVVLANDQYLYWGVGDGSAYVRGNSSSDYVSFGTVGVERMRLDSSGNVGIGTATPGANLQVGAPASGSQVIALAYSAVSAATIDFRANGSAFGAGWIQHDAASGAMRFATAGDERMRLDASGNFGIGTASAGSIAKLTVSNTGTADNNRLGVSASNYLSLPSFTASFLGQGDISASGTQCGLNNASLGYLLFQNTTAGLIYTNGGVPLVFGTSGNERMRIDSSGNLIYRVNGTAPTLSTNSTMSFELTSNTSLKIVVRGTDGTTRSVSLTLA